jgi:hypothetical protein
MPCGCELLDNAGLDLWDLINGVLSVSNLWWPLFIIEMAKKPSHVDIAPQIGPN